MGEPTRAWVVANTDDDWADDLLIRKPVPQLRTDAHKLFDPIWQLGHVSRSHAYRLLATEMGLPVARAHFKQMRRDRLDQAFPAIQRLRWRFGIDPWPVEK